MRTEKLSDSSKAKLRALALARRDALPADVRIEYGRVILQQIFEIEDFRRAQTVLAFCGFGTEIDTAPLLHEILRRGKVLLLPKINRTRKALDIYQVQNLATDLIAGVWGILEPDPARCELRALSDIQLAIVPGVAFDRHGGRIGYGKGYYDGLLAQCHPLTIGAAFEVQVFDVVPMEPHDARISTLVTEAGC